MRAVGVLGLATGALVSCGSSGDDAYGRAIACYAGQSAIYDEAKRAGVPMPAAQDQAVRTAIAIYRDRALTLARADGGDRAKLEADVNAYLKDFAKRYEESPDKPAMDRALQQQLAVCSGTLN